MKKAIIFLNLLVALVPLASYAADIEIVKLGNGLGVKSGSAEKKFLYQGCDEAYNTMQKRTLDGGLASLNNNIVKQILKDASIKPNSFKEYCMHKAGMVTLSVIKNNENMQNIVADESTPIELRKGISCILERTKMQDFAFVTGYYIYKQMWFALNQGGGKMTSLKFMAEPESDNLVAAVSASCVNAMGVRN